MSEWNRISRKSHHGRPERDAVLTVGKSWESDGGCPTELVKREEDDRNVDDGNDDGSSSSCDTISSWKVGCYGSPLISTLSRSYQIVIFNVSHPCLNVVCPCDTWSSLLRSHSSPPSTLPSYVSVCVPSCLMMCPKSVSLCFCISLKSCCFIPFHFD